MGTAGKADLGDLPSKQGSRLLMRECAHHSHPCPETACDDGLWASSMDCVTLNASCFMGCVGAELVLTVIDLNLGYQMFTPCGRRGICPVTFEPLVWSVSRGAWSLGPGLALICMLVTQPELPCSVCKREMRFHPLKVVVCKNHTFDGLGASPLSWQHNPCLHKSLTQADLSPPSMQQPGSALSPMILVSELEHLTS